MNRIFPVAFALLTVLLFCQGCASRDRAGTNAKAVLIGPRPSERMLVENPGEEKNRTIQVSNVPPSLRGKKTAVAAQTRSGVPVTATTPDENTAATMSVPRSYHPLGGMVRNGRVVTLDPERAVIAFRPLKLNVATPAPGLLEDAAIASSIRGKFASRPALRRDRYQVESRSGVVELKCINPELDPLAEAITLSLDTPGVEEVRAPLPTHSTITAAR